MLTQFWSHTYLKLRPICLAAKCLPKPTSFVSLIGMFWWTGRCGQWTEIWLLSDLSCYLLTVKFFCSGCNRVLCHNQLSTVALQFYYENRNIPYFNRDSLITRDNHVLFQFTEKPSIHVHRLLKFALLAFKDTLERMNRYTLKRKQTKP